MLGIFENHEYAFVVKNYLLQTNDVDMIDLPTQLTVNKHPKSDHTAISRTAD
jgi:hypothetical protein